jgi:nicotinamidase/pyrazinamidase
MTDIALDPRTAVIVIDVQNDFADPRGSLYVADGERTIPVINDLIAAARRAGAPVVYTRDWHPAVTPHFADYGGLWPVHCVQGTWGAEPHPDLDFDGEVVSTGANGEDGYSGFFHRDLATGEDVPTALRGLLEERGVERLVLVGLATDYCVKETALDAVKLGFGATVLTDAVAAVDLRPGDGERALAEVADAGVVLAATEGG